MGDRDLPPEIVRTLSAQAQTIAVLTRDLAVLTERGSTFTRDMEGLHDELREVKKELDQIRDMATRWKGGIGVILGIGGLLGFLASFADKIAKVFK